MTLVLRATMDGLLEFAKGRIPHVETEGASPGRPDAGPVRPHPMNRAKPESVPTIFLEPGMRIFLAAPR
jgi:hypothetical protein